MHATIGPTRLRDQVQELVTHDNAHLEQIISLRERLDKKRAEGLGEGAALP